MQKPRYEPLNIDGTGYGVDINLTRREWQDLCLTKLLEGANSFNSWQLELLKAASLRSSSVPPTFEVDILYDDDSTKNSRLGWSDNSHFILDLSNKVIDGHVLDLSGYHFLNGSVFYGATFNCMVFLRNCVFEKAAYFIGVNFNRGAILDDSLFKELVIFDNSIFRGTFNAGWDTRFEAGAKFKSVEFMNHASLQGTQLVFLECDGTHFHRDADFSGVIKLNDNKLQTIGRTSFSGVHFEGKVNFSNREFIDRATFGAYEGKNTIFDVAPLFHNSKLHQDTTFMYAEFPTSSENDPDATRAYNTLRLAMSQRQSTRDEQRFLKLELDAERVMQKRLVRSLYWLYKFFSDYGLSAKKPFILLILIPLIFAGMIYGGEVSKNHCISLMSSSCSFDSTLAMQTITYDIIQALPPLGLEKTSESLRGVLYPNITASWLLVVAIQKLLALLGWFFVALALRNVFKMK